MAEAGSKRGTVRAAAARNALFLPLEQQAHSVPRLATIPPAPVLGAFILFSLLGAGLAAGPVVAPRLLGLLLLVAAAAATAAATASAWPRRGQQLAEVLVPQPARRHSAVL